MSSISETWGTTPEERRLAFPCDNLIAEADDALYRGVTVNASPSTVFRWLCQMRVAPYSYDWIDNGGKRSPAALTPGLGRIWRLVRTSCASSLSARLKRIAT